MSLEIDIELRDVWECLDEARGAPEDFRLAVIANSMRVAYERGRREGEVVGYGTGHDHGFQEGYEVGLAEASDDREPTAPVDSRA